jgi:hypothetical protein
MKSNVTTLKTKVELWAERITNAYGDSVSAIIEVGRQLVVARRECGDGGWGELTGRTTGKTLLPFGDRTAHRLKAIAENPALSNVTHGSHLPASWRTLAVLASLDPDDIEAAIADGTIHPEMERKDAEALKAGIEAQRKPKLALSPSAEIVPITAPQMSPEERSAWEEGMKEGGQMIADFAERQAERERAKAEFSQKPENQAAAEIYREILAHLEASDRLLDGPAFAYLDMAFWDAAMRHARRIVNHLEKLPCK